MKKNLFLHIRYLLLICISLIAVTSFTDANRKPEITTSLGGLPISCSIYSDQASLAGIHTDDPLNRVISTLGNPLRIVTHDESYMTYFYRGLEIGLKKWGPDVPYTVVDMVASYGDKMYTLDGICIGMSEKSLQDVYGMADVVCVEKTYSPKLSKQQNEQIQKRINRKTYTYHAHTLLSMMFSVNNGTISEIRIHRAD